MSQFKDSSNELQYSGSSIEDQLKPVQSLLDTMQTAFSLILGTSSLILLTGFVIVNAYLLRVTDIHLLSVSTRQCIAAGFLYVFVWLVVAAAFRLWPFGTNFFWEPIPEARDLKMLQDSLRYQYEERNKLQIEFHNAKLATYMHSTSPAYAEAPDLTIQELGEIETRANELQEKLANVSNEIIHTQLLIGNMRDKFRRKLRERGLRIFGKETALLLIVSIFYAAIIYPVIPHALGGGKPTAVVLALKPEYPVTSFELSRGSNQSNTSFVLLLAELEDGLLVKDPATGRIVVVKDEAIIGIIDDDSEEILFQPTLPATPGNNQLSTKPPVPPPAP